MEFEVDHLRWRDLGVVLRIQRSTFSDDRWTSDTLGGRLARSPVGSDPRLARLLVATIQFFWVAEILMLVRMGVFLLLGRPAGREVLVARSDSRLVGYAIHTANPDGTEDYQSIAVLPDSGRKGMGRAMFGQAFEQAVAAGTREITLMVKAGNDHAHRLYRSFGFVDEKVLERYYQPSGADAILMRWTNPAFVSEQPGAGPITSP